MAGKTVLVIDDSPTILKVVELVLTKAGFQIETATDGEAGLAAAQQTAPDLILLDFVMPRMNGYQFCRALANEGDLKNTPVVLMSAKGDQVGERFVKVMGIVDYITKPFSPEAITAVVQHTIAKYGSGLREDDTLPIIGSDAADELLRGQEVESAERSRALDAVRDKIAQAVADHVAGLASLADAAAEEEDAEIAVPSDSASIEDATRYALADEVLLDVLRAAQPIRTTALRGDVRVFPIAEVLQLLDVQEQTGVLRVERAQGRVEIFFQRGRVNLARATGVSDEFLLGRFIVDGDLMSKSDFDAFLQARIGETSLLGAELVELGHISESDLQASLRKQSCDLIYEILRWRTGHFEFVSTSETAPEAAQASLGLDVEGVLMEGFRRVDEWHLIEREVDDFQLVFLRNEDAVAQMGRGRLTREELAVLEMVNGKNTVKDIIRRSRMGSFEVSKMLYRLLSIKLIRRRVLPVAV